MPFEQHLRNAGWQCQTRFLSRSPKQKRFPCFLGNELWRIEVLDPSFRFHAASYDPFLYLIPLKTDQKLHFRLFSQYVMVSFPQSPVLRLLDNKFDILPFDGQNGIVHRVNFRDLIWFKGRQKQTLHLDKTGGSFVSPAFHRLHTFIASSRLVLSAIKKQSTRQRRFRFVNWVNDTATVSVLNRNTLLLCVHLTIHENRIGNAVLTWHTC